MTVVQKFEYDWPEGVTPIDFVSWTQTLSQEEQDEFSEARRRQESYRQEAIDAGRMQMIDGTYVWVDQTAAKLNKKSDPIWVRYWRRYLKETQTRFSTILEEQNDQKAI
jgi:hypothetical protein